MADPLSIAFGITNLATLSTNVLAAGYRYLSSVSSAPEEFKGLLRETAALSAVLSQLISHSLSERPVNQIGSQTLVQQEILQDCEETLLNVQSLISDCELVGKNGKKNPVNAVLWPLKKDKIIKNRERLCRLCASLHTSISIESASTLRHLKQDQEWSNAAIGELTLNAHGFQEQKILEWLSTLDSTAKHTATMLLKQPGTDEWFLRERSVLDWLDHGKLLWVHASSGRGKTVLMSVCRTCQYCASMN